MVAKSLRIRPGHVPQENVYKQVHWLLILTYMAAAAAVYMLIASGG